MKSRLLGSRRRSGLRGARQSRWSQRIDYASGTGGAVGLIIRDQRTVEGSYIYTYIPEAITLNPVVSACTYKSASERHCWILTGDISPRRARRISSAVTPSWRCYHGSTWRRRTSWIRTRLQRCTPLTLPRRLGGHWRALNRPSAWGSGRICQSILRSSLCLLAVETWGCMCTEAVRLVTHVEASGHRR